MIEPWTFLNERQPGWQPLKVQAQIVNNRSVVPVTTTDILNIARGSTDQRLLSGLANVTLQGLKAGIGANPNVFYQPTQGKDTSNIESIKKAASDRIKELAKKKTTAASKQLNTGASITRNAGKGLKIMGIDPQVNLQLKLTQGTQPPKLNVGKKVQQTVNELFDLLGDGAVPNQQAQVNVTDGKKVRAKQMIAKLFAAQNIVKKPALGIKQFSQLPEFVQKAYPQQVDGVLTTAKGKPIIYKPRDLNKAQQLMKTQIGPDYGGNVVKGLFTLANEAFRQAGFQQMGPAGKGKLPLYIGRWLDEKTNMVKIPSKNRTVTNPIVWKDKFNQSVYNMAYKWNTFVKSAQQVKNLIDNKTYWKDTIKAKAKANSLAMIKKRQVFNLLKSIGNGNALFQATEVNQRDQILKFIKEWNYDSLARLLQKIGFKKLSQADNFTPAGVKRVAEYWSKFEQNAVKAFVRFQVMSKIKPGSVMSKEQYKRAVLETLSTVPTQVRNTPPAGAFRTGGGGFRKVFMNKLKKANFQPDVLQQIQTAIEKPTQQQPALSRDQILEQLRKGIDNDEDTAQLSYMDQVMGEGGGVENEMMNRATVMA